jgi:Protein of unknown function (DUF2752)
MVEPENVGLATHALRTTLAKKSLRAYSSDVDSVQRPTVENLPSFIRWLALVAGISMLSLLIVARLLTPALTGLGTHQQLGLPPCTSLMLWGMPCPACGMTTSWAYATRGQLIAAAQVNCGGMMLSLIALAVVPASCYFFITGRATRGRWFSTALAICLVLALGLATIQWIVRIWV